jgi:hypothetical protein
MIALTICLGAIVQDAYNKKPPFGGFMQKNVFILRIGADIHIPGAVQMML